MSPVCQIDGWMNIQNYDSITLCSSIARQKRVVLMCNVYILHRLAITERDNVIMKQRKRKRNNLYFNPINKTKILLNVIQHELKTSLEMIFTYNLQKKTIICRGISSGAIYHTQKFM